MRAPMQEEALPERAPVQEKPRQSPRFVEDVDKIRNADRSQLELLNRRLERLENDLTRTPRRATKSSAPKRTRKKR